MKISALFATALIAVPTLALAGEEKSPVVEHYRPYAFAEQGLPFAEAVRAGDLLFVSGAIGIDPETGELAEGGIGPETRLAMEEIRRVVENHGGAMDRVVKCTVFLADIREWAAMNQVYVTFFKPEKLPARSALGTSGLSMGARVEIECIAALGE